MRRLPAIALAGALAFAGVVALADGPGHTIGIAPGKLVPSRGAPASCTPVIPDDAGTVFHLYVCGGAVIDTKGAVFHTVGAVTPVAKTSLGFPNGKSAEGITGFSSTNYLWLDEGPINISAGGTFYVSLIVKAGPGPSNVTAFKEILGASSGSYTNSSGAGYDVSFQGNGGQEQIQTPTLWSAGGGASTILAGNVAENAIVLYSAGWGASNHKIYKLNTAAAADIGAGIAMLHGVWGAAIGYSTNGPLPGGQPGSPFDGTIFEIMVSTTAPTIAMLDALHNTIRN